MIRKLPLKIDAQINGTDVQGTVIRPVYRRILIPHNGSRFVEQCLIGEVYSDRLSPDILKPYSLAWQQSKKPSASLHVAPNPIDTPW